MFKKTVDLPTGCTTSISDKLQGTIKVSLIVQKPFDEKIDDLQGE